jgi:hypothetical protein
MNSNQCIIPWPWWALHVAIPVHDIVFIFTNSVSMCVSMSRYHIVLAQQDHSLLEP